MPSPKEAAERVTVPALVGALVVVLCWVAKQFYGIEIPNYVASAITTILMFFAALLTKAPAGTG
jgi:hypothetical protein